MASLPCAKAFNDLVASDQSFALVEVDFAGIKSAQSDGEFDTEAGAVENFAIGNDEANAFDGLT